MTSEIVSLKAITEVIYLVRGQRVLIDRDLPRCMASRREFSIRQQSAMQIAFPMISFFDFHGRRLRGYHNL